MHRTIIKFYRDSFSGLPRDAWWLALVEFANQSGTMVIFFMSLYAIQELGFSVKQAGMTMGFFGAGGLAGSYLGGRLTDHWGFRKVQQIGLVSTALFLWMTGLASQPSLVFSLMFFLGACNQMQPPANMTAVAEFCPGAIRVKGYSLLRLAANAGVSIGPVLGGFLALINYHWLFWVDGTTCLVAVLIQYFTLGRKGKLTPPPSSGTGLKPSSPWQDKHFLYLMLLVFGVGMVFSQVLSTFPLYLRQVYGLRENLIGPLIMINTLLILICQMPMIHRLAPFAPAKVIRWGCLFLCGGFALMPLGRGFLYAGLTVVVWTAGEIIAIPVMSTLVASYAPEGKQGGFQGIYSFTFSLALIAGPVLGAWIYQGWNRDRLWYLVGLMGLVLFAGFSQAGKLCKKV
jgi:MFS family permease